MKKLIPIITLLIILFFARTVNAKEGSYTVHFIATEQSDCILIKGQNKNYLIDTARDINSSEVLEYLKKQGVNRIEAVIVTHYHDDHYGGLKNIAEQKEVAKVILPANQPSYREYLFSFLKNKNIKVEYINSDFGIKDRNIDLKAVLTRKEDKVIENNNSVVIVGTIDNIKYAFLADVEKQREKELVKFKEVENCDVMKVPHHGLNTSSSEELIKSVNPRVVIITSDGIESPEKKVLERFSKCEGVLFRTDKQGNIVVKGNSANKAIDILSSKVIK